MDTNNDCVLDGGETVLRVGDALQGGDSLTSGAGCIGYNTTGSVAAAATFSLCHASGLRGRQMSLSATGRVNMNSQYMCP